MPLENALRGVLIGAVCLLQGALAAAAPAGPADSEPIAAIRKAAESRVRAQLAHGPAEVRASADAIDRRLRLARCATALESQLPPPGEWQTRVVVGVSCASPHWSVYVPVSIESRIGVLILRHAVAREARLTQADVLSDTRLVAGLGAAFVSSPDELQGRTVLRSLPAGTTLTVDMFRPDLIVRQGQAVTLVAQGGGIEVRAAGRALGDAAAGARLKVQNLSSMRVIEGIAESGEIVRVGE